MKARIRDQMKSGSIMKSFFRLPPCEVNPLQSFIHAAEPKLYVPYEPMPTQTSTVYVCMCEVIGNVTDLR